MRANKTIGTWHLYYMPLDPKGEQTYSFFPHAQALFPDWSHQPPKHPWLGATPCLFATIRVMRSAGASNRVFAFFAPEWRREEKVSGRAFTLPVGVWRDSHLSAPEKSIHRAILFRIHTLYTLSLSLQRTLLVLMRCNFIIAFIPLKPLLFSSWPHINCVDVLTECVYIDCSAWWLREAVFIHRQIQSPRCNVSHKARGNCFLGNASLQRSRSFFLSQYPTVICCLIFYRVLLCEQKTYPVIHQQKKPGCICMFCYLFVTGELLFWNRNLSDTIRLPTLF